MLFLDFYGRSGKHDLKDLERADLEAFIEHEQDRGLKISTVKTRMAFIIAFLHFLIEQDLIPGSCPEKNDQAQAPRYASPGDSPQGCAKAPLRDPQHPGPGPHPASLADRHQDR